MEDYDENEVAEQEDALPNEQDVQDLFSYVNQFGEEEEIESETLAGFGWTFDDQEDLFEDDDDFQIDFELDDEVLEEGNRVPQFNSEASKVKQIANMFMPKLKGKNVNYEEVNDQIKSFISTLPDHLKDKVLVTSGRDGKHAKNSKHYFGNAIDLRYNPELHNYIEQNAKKAGLSTMNPFHGTAPHTHLQVMQYGGSQIPYNPIYPSYDHLSSIQPLTPLNPTPQTLAIDTDYLNRKFTNDMNTALTPVREGTLPPASIGSSLNTGAITNGVSSLQKGIQVKENVEKQINDIVYNMVNSGLDAAISTLGANEQNRNFRRMNAQRSEETKGYEYYSPQIKNIPVY